jgi:SNF2 family DNA or RNA helicase
MVFSAASSIGVDLVDLSRSLDEELRHQAEQRRTRQREREGNDQSGQTRGTGATPAPPLLPSPPPSSPSSPSLLHSTIVSGAKVAWVLQFVRRLRATRPHDKLVIFSQFTRMLDLLQIVLPTLPEVGEQGVVRFDGQMKVDDQQRSLHAFNTEPCSSLSILLISLQAGGVGLSLTVANHCVMLSPWWNPAIEGQAYDRIHRMSQHKDVFIHRCLITEGVEQRLITIQHDKGSLAREAMQDHSHQPEEEEEQEDEHSGEEGTESSGLVRGQGRHTAKSRSKPHDSCDADRSGKGLTLQALQQLFDCDDQDIPNGTR